MTDAQNTPGTRKLFHDQESVFQGAYFSSPETVSGLKAGVSLRDGGSQPAVNLAIGHGFTGGLPSLVFGGLGIIFAGLGGAGAIAAVTSIKRKRALSAQKGTT